MNDNNLNLVSEFDQLEILLDSVIKYSLSTTTVAELNEYRDELERTIRSHKAVENQCSTEADKERYLDFKTALTREILLFNDKGQDVVNSATTVLKSL